MASKQATPRMAAYAAANSFCVQHQGVKAFHRQDHLVQHLKFCRGKQPRNEATAVVDDAVEQPARLGPLSQQVDAAGTVEEQGQQHFVPQYEVDNNLNLRQSARTGFVSGLPPSVHAPLIACPVPGCTNTYVRDCDLNEHLLLWHLIAVPENDISGHTSAMGYRDTSNGDGFGTMGYNNINNGSNYGVMLNSNNNNTNTNTSYPIMFNNSNINDFARVSSVNPSPDTWTPITATAGYNLNQAEGLYQQSGGWDSNAQPSSTLSGDNGWANSAQSSADAGFENFNFDNGYEPT
ncbi:hypothetical protein NPX13_g1694 [Xylaria arbuscula]|uniref:C2H2-type domain-containing protein n=1 Tax=Xylaria arbuscula TaxID=114810 RepID=A0A9W8NKL1_9PEZI|nr:hypothetical protein NPX13_g1694 [Xylaria arbuscula]